MPLLISINSGSTNFGGDFGVMGIILDFGERAIAVLINLVSLLKGLNRKALLITGAIAAVALLMVGAYFLGRTDGQTPEPVPSSSSSPLPPESAGGLDLAKYCESYGFTQVDTNFCTESIDLNNACKWQFKRTDLVIDTPNGPYSGRCVDRQKKSVGGIRDMAGYCREAYHSSTCVQPVVIGEVWTCQAPINKDLACGWQYQTENLRALEQTTGIWVCSKP